MLRREFISAAAALGLRGCRELMPGRYNALVTQQAHPTQTAALEYRLGTRTFRVGRPRIAFQTTGFAHFAGMNLQASGNVLLRVNTGADTDQSVGSETHRLSTDGGNSFDPSTDKAVVGSHTNNEPITLCADGKFRGPVFTYVTYPYLGDNTKCAINRQVIDTDGTCTQTTNGTVVSGLPRVAISGDESAIGFSTHISWCCNVVAISANQWVSILHVQFVGDNYFTMCLVECTDGIGAAWTYIATVNPIGPGDAEACLVRTPSGTLVCFSRANGGDNFLYRFTSSDVGRTWGGRTAMWAWGKAPCAALLDPAQSDGVLLSGIAPYSVDSYPYGQALRYTADLTSGGTTELTGWPSVDLIAHHNLMILDNQYQFLPGGVAPPSWRPKSSAYCSIVRLASNRLLISYDEVARANGDLTRLTNRIWVVNVDVT